MEDLIKRLQEEAGLTQEQAMKAISVLKAYMEQEGIETDWDKFFKGKYGEFVSTLKDAYQNVSKQTEGYTEKIVSKVDELATKAKKGAHDISQKAADFFDEK